jgi:iron complex outermembrane receptor protein
MQNLLRSKYLAPALLYVSFCLPTLADEESMSVLGDIETVSIATGREQPIVVAPAVTTVFKSDDIKNTGARNLADLLNMVPGIHVGISTIRYDPIFAVRGFSSSLTRHILIMVDGVPRDDLALGEKLIALGKIPIDIIDRVEISRGPGSALWGADAFSAVVNIITKAKKPDVSSIAIGGGSYNTRNTRIHTGFDTKKLDAVAAIEYSKSSGHEPIIIQDRQTVLDERYGTNASYAPAKAATGSEEVGAQINLSDKYSKLSIGAFSMNNIGMGIGYAAALDPFGKIDNEGVEVKYKYDQLLTTNFNYGATLSYSYSNTTLDSIHFLPPGSFGNFPNGVVLNGEYKQDHLKAKLYLDYSEFEDHHISFGIGGEKGELNMKNESRNYTTLDGIIIPIDMQSTLLDPAIGKKNHSRDLKFMYLHDEWEIYQDWFFTLGARSDDYSDFGSVTSQRAVLVWNTNHLLTTKFLFGRGYRLPLILSTVSEHIPAIESNPNLRPEKFDQIQLILDYQIRYSLRGSINLFYHETVDQIRQQSTEGAGIRPVNLGKQIGRGVELELWWDIAPRTKLYSFYAYQDNTEVVTRRDTGYSPHHKLFAMLQHEHYGGWYFNTKATYVGSRDRIPYDSRSDADTYTIVDVLMRKELTQHLGITFEIRNIFDKEADEASFGVAFPGDMPMPGRNYYLTITSKY